MDVTRHIFFDFVREAYHFLFRGENEALHALIYYFATFFFPGEQKYVPL
jgi:hypothetical protein